MKNQFDDDLYNIEWNDIENADMDYENYLNDIEDIFREDFEEELTLNKENMKLISMTDFVLQYKGNTEFHMNDTVLETGKLMQRIFKYAEFLQLPLTLGMFVPVDEEGDVIEKPSELTYQLVNDDNHTASKWIIEQYEKAKEKVLFEVKIKHRENFFILEDEDGTWIRVLKNDTSLTVEDLLRMSSVMLTPSALKQLGL